MNIIVCFREVCLFLVSVCFLADFRSHSHKSRAVYTDIQLKATKCTPWHTEAENRRKRMFKKINRRDWCKQFRQKNDNNSDEGEAIARPPKPSKNSNELSRKLHRISDFHLKTLVEIRSDKFGVYLINNQNKIALFAARKIIVNYFDRLSTLNSKSIIRLIGWTVPYGGLP